MGANKSPILAKMVMNEVPEYITEGANFRILQYLIYVDDILLIIPRYKLDDILKLFNSFNPNLVFTIEIEREHKMPFLDILLINYYNTFLDNLYRTPTSITKILNFFSQTQQVDIRKKRF